MNMLKLRQLSSVRPSAPVGFELHKTAYREFIELFNRSAGTCEPSRRVQTV
jgi:hypothetical protein